MALKISDSTHQQANPDFAVPWLFFSTILFFILNNLLNVG
jgi:hypothetical protein